MDASSSTDASPCAIGFIGDLNDPWVFAIADALSMSREVVRVNHAGSLPAWPFEGARPPRAVVIHRHKVGPTDAERLREWRVRRRPAGTTGPLRQPLCSLRRTRTLVEPRRFRDLGRGRGGRLARSTRAAGWMRPAATVIVVAVRRPDRDRRGGRRIVSRPGRCLRPERLLRPAGRRTRDRRASASPSARSDRFGRAARAHDLGSAGARAGVAPAPRMARASNRPRDRTGRIRGSCDRRPRQGGRGRRVPRAPMRSRRSG